MTVVIAISAFAIDVGTWYAKHHQAQVVADSAALAAANCLANPGHSTTMNINGTVKSVPACTDGADTADATTVAEDYAAANGVTITSSDISFTPSTSPTEIKVNPHISGPTFFANLFGIHATTESASAGAGWTTPSGSCSNPGAGCDFMFAHNSNCSSSTNGIYFAIAGNTAVSGNIQSNGNLSGGLAGNISLGTATYGPNGTSACSNTVSYAGHNPWTTPPTQAPADLPWPIDYTKDFPACGGAGELACASSGYPTFCTNEASNITFSGSGSNGDIPVSGNIYCASGTGTKSTPSTWNGSISISASGSYSTWYDSFVAGTITVSTAGQTSFSPCGYAIAGYTAAECSSTVPVPTTTNYPVFYAIGTSSTAINVSLAGGQTINGDLFAPNGTAYLAWAGNKTVVSFIEANNISANIAGTFQGDGPSGGTTGGSSGGTDTLLQ